jgi:hypothetical protein
LSATHGKVKHKTLDFPGPQRVHTSIATINPESAMSTSQTTQANYQQFVAELTALTRKYGVAIQSVGGVMLADTQGQFSEVSYRADISSGDLYPQFPQD